MDCDNDLRTLVKTRLDAFPRNEATDSDARHAAVALGILETGHGADLCGMPQHTEWSSAAALLLTRRSSKLKDHPGQWALPGGSADSGETPIQTALREMHEEVGLEISESEVLGRLDDFVTRSGFIISPVVVWLGKGVNPVPNPTEVDSVHRIPVSEFLRDDAPLLDHDETDSDHPVLRMPVGDTWIAAPTAALLYQFSEVCIRGLSTRVAHFDQPKFAWR